VSAEPLVRMRGISKAFGALRARGRTALIPYLTAGYPSPAATHDALCMLPEAGADLIELGIPFSDPLADGPVIQRASQAALEAGMTVRGVLELVSGAAALGVPIVLFTYLSRWDQTPDRPERVRVHFDKGRPLRVELLDEERKSLGQGVEVKAGESLVPVVELLNKVGGRHGVGLVDMVESRYVGLKSRGVYEAPAHAILLAAHEDLESLVHDHRLLHEKAKRAYDVAEAVYQGKWFTQEMQSWLAANAVEQARVSGWSELRLYKGSILPVARHSPHSLYDEAAVSFDTASADYDPQSARGFIDIQAVEQQAQMRQKRGLGQGSQSSQRGDVDAE